MMDRRILTCIGCPLGCALTAVHGEAGYEISGYTCKRGLEYAKKELTRPERTVTSTVRVSGGRARVISVRTASDIPKDAIFAVMEAVNGIVAPAPIAIGDVLCENIAGTGVPLVATKAVKAR
jgi:CxxC motif-containing protein